MSNASYGYSVKTYYGIEFGDLNPTAEAAIAGRILFPSEVPPLEYFEDVQKRDISASKKLRSSLELAYRRGREDDVRKADSVCRNLGHAIAQYAGDVVPLEPPFTFDRSSICFDDLRIACPEPVTVVDHGIGFNGVFPHNAHIKTANHRVFASVVDNIEAGGVEGVAQALHYPEDSLIVVPGAMDLTEELLDNDFENEVDMILASYVHVMERKTLRAALAAGPRLLRPGGLVIIRSPKSYPGGLSASEQAGIIAEDPSMKLFNSYDTTSASTNMNPNVPQQAFVFTKIA